jgi:hypothetical protein
MPFPVPSHPYLGPSVFAYSTTARIQYHHALTYTRLFTVDKEGDPQRSEAG